MRSTHGCTVVKASMAAASLLLCLHLQSTAFHTYFADEKDIDSTSSAFLAMLTFVDAELSINGRAWIDLRYTAYI